MGRVAGNDVGFGQRIKIQWQHRVRRQRQGQTGCLKHGGLCLYGGCRCLLSWMEAPILEYPCVSKSGLNYPACHTCTIPSPLPEATNLLLGDHVTAFTMSIWPL